MPKLPEISDRNVPEPMHLHVEIAWISSVIAARIVAEALEKGKPLKTSSGDIFIQKERQEYTKK